MQILDFVSRLILTRWQLPASRGITLRLGTLGSRKTVSISILMMLLVAVVFTGVGSDSAEAAELPPTYLTQLGTSGTGDGQYNFPAGVAIDSLGNVFVVDFTAARVQKFANDGTFISKWGSPGAGNSQFNQARGIALDSNDNVYVVDSGNKRVQKFDSAGSFISTWGTAGTSTSQFTNAAAIAIDTSDNVYVTDFSNYNVQKFSNNGTFILSWGSFGTSNGQFSSPRGIAIDSAGSVYVSDFVDHRIQKFDSNGNYLSGWGSNGSGAGQFQFPIGMAFGPGDRLYVADDVNGRVQKFTTGGIFLSEWGSGGAGNGQFDLMFDVAVDAAGSIFVSDFVFDYGGSGRVQVFNPQNLDIAVSSRASQSSISDLDQSVSDLGTTVTGGNSALSSTLAEINAKLDHAHSALIAFDKDVYEENRTATITLTDADESNSLLEFNVHSSSDPAGITSSAIQFFPGTGVFEATVELSSSLASDKDAARLFATDGDTITATYTDLTPAGFGSPNVSDTATVSEQVAIQGQVVLQGRGDVSGVLAIALEPSGGGAISPTVLLADGTFAFDDILPGKYRLRATADSFLSALTAEFTVADQDVSFPLFTLGAGDVNKDQVVSILDLSAAASNFGSGSPLVWPSE
ncbi:MAG: hypothetical protein HQ478_11545 [Chloroflexi bacterium]|nr:hypothetical protein [Chloroflexota bacterium]